MSTIRFFSCGLLFLILLASCGSQKIKFVSVKYKHIQEEFSPLEKTVASNEFVSFESGEIVRPSTVENDHIEDLVVEIEKSEDRTINQNNRTKEKRPLLNEWIIHESKSISALEEEPVKKDRWIFEDAFYMYLISSGLMIFAIIGFVLISVSIYLPVVGFILSLAGFYFFFRALSEYRWAKDKLKWQPKEYAKSQKVGWVTALMIFNILLLCAGIAGMLSIIF